MMNAVYATVSNIRALPECWLFANRTYTYMDGSRNAGLNKPSLPTISGEYTSLLDSMNIPYRQKSDNVFEMWDPACFEEVEIRLPLYIREGNNFRYIKAHTGIILSQETKKLAFELYESTVEPQIEEIEHTKKLQKLIAHLTDVLDGAPACGLKYTTDDLLADCYSEMDLDMDGKHIMVFPVYARFCEEKQAKIIAEMESVCMDTSTLKFNRSTEYIAVFDADKLSVGDVVSMRVPAGVEALFVGRAGWQVKEWCSKFGLTKINVKGV